MVVMLKEVPITMGEINVLAIYNSEVARGVLHTWSWETKMIELQRRFDASRKQDKTV